MGHGDEIVIADAHFPGHTFSDTVIRADGLLIPDLLAAIMPLWDLDQYVDAPLAMMRQFLAMSWILLLRLPIEPPLSLTARQHHISSGSNALRFTTESKKLLQS